MEWSASEQSSFSGTSAAPEIEPDNSSVLTLHLASLSGSTSFSKEVCPSELKEITIGKLRRLVLASHEFAPQMAMARERAREWALRSFSGGDNEPRIDAVVGARLVLDRTELSRDSESLAEALARADTELSRDSTVRGVTVLIEAQLPSEFAVSIDSSCSCHSFAAVPSKTFTLPLPLDFSSGVSRFGEETTDDEQKPGDAASEVVARSPWSRPRSRSPPLPDPRSRGFAGAPTKEEEEAAMPAEKAVRSTVLAAILEAVDWDNLRERWGTGEPGSLGPSCHFGEHVNVWNARMRDALWAVGRARTAAERNILLQRYFAVSFGAAAWEREDQGTIFEQLLGLARLTSTEGEDFVRGGAGSGAVGSGGAGIPPLSRRNIVGRFRPTMLRPFQLHLALYSEEGERCRSA